MKAGSAWVLLVFVWEVLLLFGSLVPLTLLPLTMIVVVHGLLFAHISGLRDIADSVHLTLPRSSVWLAMACAVIMQLSATSESSIMSLTVLVAATSAVSSWGPRGA
eukprot:5995710-Amphidinium_carterae.1